MSKKISRLMSPAELQSNLSKTGRRNGNQKTRTYDGSAKFNRNQDVLLLATRAEWTSLVETNISTTKTKCLLVSRNKDCKDSQ
ncbi:unnamed protein product [Nezara viridula]|uniref:Uncharacterized protein n=1 Tax=Nezara viridula TaxID=85310 RepID=A0A9P0HNN9_NEZVI|nr:unnamed protein product [Nezara viridula]